MEPPILAGMDTRWDGRWLFAVSQRLENVGPFCQDVHMRIGAFELYDAVPKLSMPHAFMMVRPWVDVGSVGTLTLASLENHFGAIELGKLARPGKFFDFTRYRPTMRLHNSNREVELPNSIIKYAQTPEGQDYLFFHLMEPHAQGEDYTDSVLEVFKYFQISRYCRFGGMYDAVPHTRPLLVTGDTGRVDVKGNGGNLRRRRSTYQGPTTILNLITEGVPKLDPRIDVMNFMVHLPQYLQVEEDYLGASRLLEVLGSIYDLPSDLPPSARGQEQYQQLSSAVERNGELTALINQLEANYDAQEAGHNEERNEPAPLAPEVEQFLEEMDRRFGDTSEQT